MREGPNICYIATWTLGASPSLDVEPRKIVQSPQSDNKDDDTEEVQAGSPDGVSELREFTAQLCCFHIKGSAQGSKP